MLDNDRRIKESPLYMGPTEQVAYTLTTTPWGSSPSSVSCVLYDSAGADVSSTHNIGAGTATASGDTITSWPVGSIDANEVYQFVWTFTISGNIEVAWADVHGQAY